MFSQRKNCRIDEWLKFEWMEFWSDWTEFRSIGRNSDLLDGIPIWLDGIWNWLDGIPTWLNGMLSKCWCRKKIGVDWSRPSRFRKNFSKCQCSNRKIGVDRSRQSQKRPLQRQVSLNFFRTGHPGVAECVLHFDGLPLTRGAVVATPFAAAVSLTFSLVKNLQMLLQAKRQPG